MANVQNQHGQPIHLVAEPLTAAGFAPFGDVIEAGGDSRPINQGKGRRFPDLAQLDLDAEGGHAAVSIVTCVAEARPVPLRLMERHPLGTQVFMPLNGQRYLVVVAPAGQAPGVSDFRAFVADGHQGINYHRGVWHHPMIALDADCAFVEVHRGGPGANCDETPIHANVMLDFGDGWPR